MCTGIIMHAHVNDDIRYCASHVLTKKFPTSIIIINCHGSGLRNVQPCASCIPDGTHVNNHCYCTQHCVLSNCDVPHNTTCSYSVI